MEPHNGVGADLLAGILAHPDDIARRLIYADYLTEQGHDNRAELIRIQVRLHLMDEAGEELIPEDGHTCSEYPCPICLLVDEYQRLLAQSDQLLKAYSWFHIPGLASFSERIGSPFSGLVHKEEGKPNYAVTVRCGFPDEVHLTIAQFMEYARTISSLYPIRTWLLSDKTPNHSHNQWWWVKLSKVNYPERNALPDPIFDLLLQPFSPNEVFRQNFRYYDSEWACRQDLQQALLRYARESSSPT